MKRVPANKVSFAEDGLYYCEGAPFTGTAYATFPNGALENESEYRDGLPWGKSRSWDMDGSLFAESDMYRDALHGAAREWSPGGQLISETVAEYGVTLREREWDEQGNLLKDYELKEGDPDYTVLHEFRKLYGSVEKK